MCRDQGLGCVRPPLPALYTSGTTVLVKSISDWSGMSQDHQTGEPVGTPGSGASRWVHERSNDETIMQDFIRLDQDLQS
ncbi:hypothetical protein NDU88_003661 [Pleurodeles waltl]|uniref:Uncharacterized protein n=1 Tax=Pleurodeles waltl TaxID=8319 RepID=A0AAV7WTF3_PLEWA|nr:hypothetical protein NDU88_003661 [Pleurodeles waltl]